ncbi:MAG: hypothetical protein VW124_16750 [Paracoccaceae bacterium]
MKDKHSRFKIAIGHKIQAGPYGGGNAFVRVLTDTLVRSGHQVFFELEQGDLDFIVMTDPRSRSPNVTFAAGSILDYLKKNPRTLVIHRINECDERKGTKTMNPRLRLANYCADHTVFVGSWLKNLNLVFRREQKSNSVILNGVDTEIFHPRGYLSWEGSGPLKLVTHHWGGNWMKGFDVYEKLDAMLASPEWRNIIEFTYIGNLPPGFLFRHATYMKPISGQALACALRANHVYVTGSINEPGGNHQIEGGACGLPLLYRNSGCMPEYCDGFGLMFEGDDIEPSLRSMLNQYSNYQPRMIHFPHAAQRTSQNWLSLFDLLDQQRERLLALRQSSLFHEIANRIPW